MKALFYSPSKVTVGKKEKSVIKYKCISGIELQGVQLEGNAETSETVAPESGCTTELPVSSSLLFQLTFLPIHLWLFLILQISSIPPILPPLPNSAMPIPILGLFLGYRILGYRLLPIFCVLFWINIPLISFIFSYELLYNFSRLSSTSWILMLYYLLILMQNILNNNLYLFHYICFLFKANYLL